MNREVKSKPCEQQDYS